MSNKNSYISFNVDENRAKKLFETFIMNQNTSPLDIAVEYQFVSIDKEMYPIRCITTQCYAEWKALSIYEQTRMVPVQKSVTVYFDKHGIEHSTGGPDFYNINGKRTAVYRTPQQKIVTEMVPQKEVVSVTPTSGTTNTKTFRDRVAFVAGERNNSLTDWLERISVENKHCDIRNMSNIKNIKLSGNVDEIKKDMEKSAIEFMCEVAKSEVPGTRFEEFHCTTYYESSEEVVYIPVYRMMYKYNDQTYEIWMNGQDERDIFCNTYPQDEQLVCCLREAENINEKESKKIIVLNLSIIAFCIVCIVFAVKGFSGSDDNFVSEIVMISTAFFACILGAICAKIDKRRKSLVSNRENVIGKAIECRNQIMELTKNSNLTKENKRAEARKIIETFNENRRTFLLKDEKTQGGIKKIVAFSVIAVFVVSTVIWAIIVPSNVKYYKQNKIDAKEFVDNWNLRSDETDPLTCGIQISSKPGDHIYFLDNGATLNYSVNTYWWVNYISTSVGLEFEEDEQEQIFELSKSLLELFDDIENKQALYEDALKELEEDGSTPIKRFFVSSYSGEYNAGYIKAQK